MKKNNYILTTQALDTNQKVIFTDKILFKDLFLVHGKTTYE